MTTVNSLIKNALDSIYTQNPQFMYFMERSDVENTLQTALETAIPSSVNLTTSKPDYESIILQFVQNLQINPAWKDVIQAGTGSILFSNIASGITYLNFSMARAVQTTFIQPGTPKSSVYTAMSSQGVNPRRKVPGKIEVQISVPDHSGSYVIPKFTQFNIANINFFNRDDIIYGPNEFFKNLILVQGSKFIQAGNAIGNNYESIEIGYDNYNISDEDVYVSVNDIDWKQSRERIWNSKVKDFVYFVSTLETGNIEIKFGNDIYGKKLEPGDDLIIIWFETLGNSIPTISTGTTFDKILEDGVPLLCQTLGSAYGMDDELPTEFYIQMGPHMRSANKTAIRRTAYKKVALDYPGVRDAFFLGQAELNPGKRNWMNIVQATVLTSNGIPMTDVEWTRFTTYMEENCIEHLEFIRRDPYVINVDMNSKVFCNSKTQLNAIKATLIDAGKEYTKPQLNSIGFSVFTSDGTSLLEGKNRQNKDIMLGNVPIKELVEYPTDFSFTYTAGFDPSILPEGVGIDSEGDVIADFYSYVKINNVNLEIFYTARRSNSGRRDFDFGS